MFYCILDTLSSYLTPSEPTGPDGSHAAFLVPSEPTGPEGTHSRSFAPSEPTAPDGAMSRCSDGALRMQDSNAACKPTLIHNHFWSRNIVVFSIMRHLMVRMDSLTPDYDSSAFYAMQKGQQTSGVYFLTYISHRRARSTSHTAIRVYSSIMVILTVSCSSTGDTPVLCQYYGDIDSHGFIKHHAAATLSGHHAVGTSRCGHIEQRTR